MRGAVAYGREATCRRGRDERQASHTLRAPQCKVEGDGAPQRVADEVEGREIERIDESADVARQPRDRVASGPRLRLPTAAQVHRIRPEASGEALEDALPPARGSEVAVHEDEHVTAGAGFFVLDAQILQVDEGHLGRISSHRWASPFIDVRHAIAGGGPAELPHPAPPSLRYLYQGYRVHQTVRENEAAVAGDRGVAHDVPAAGNGPALEFLRARVETHDGVRRRPGLAVPDHVADCGDAVGLGFRPARRLPFRHLAGRGIEAPEVPAGKVRVPDDVVARDRDAARARSGVRKRVLANVQSARIDASHAVDAELDEEDLPLRIDRHPIRTRLLRGRSEELDLARRRVEPPHPIRVLHREPENSL